MIPCNQSQHPIHRALMIDKVKVPSLHVYGDRDYILAGCVELAAAFENSVSISHSKGETDL